MSKKYYKIPLTNVPQEFDITLSDRPLHMRNRWNSASNSWQLDIFDAVTDGPLILSLPLVAGSDLLESFKHVGIPGSLYVYTEGSPNSNPTQDNLGKDANLYYVI